MRPSWDQYFLNIADAVSERSDCTRRLVGAVVVKDNRIKATGYPGVPPGEPGCLDGACPRGRHHYDNYLECCDCGNPWPCRDAVEPGSSYDTGPGACISIHAEANALLDADREDCLGATIYITHQPCYGCYKLIRRSGITRIVVKDYGDYPDKDGQ